MRPVVKKLQKANISRFMDVWNEFPADYSNSSGAQDFSMLVVTCLMGAGAHMGKCSQGQGKRSSGFYLRILLFRGIKMVRCYLN